MTARLLSTKLYVPTVRPSLVPRSRLTERLNAGLYRRLTLVSAPAGFGKTTLLSEWVADCDRPAVWVSLDEGDNDPVRFWAYFVAALQMVEAAIGESVPRAFQAPGSPSMEAVLTALINEIALVSDPFVLVLDDYHHLTAQPIHDALAFLLDHLPPTMHLAIATRADPPLPLARLRGRGYLTELRQSDLCFTAEEAATFLNNTMRLNLSAEDVTALEARTEGWIAGLQMASLAMQAQPPPAGRGKDGLRNARAEFVRAFTGSHRYVLDYLVEEVLEQQPSTVQEFLLRTSILERLNGPLCDALLGGAEDGAAEAAPIPSPSQEILEQLEAANLFIIPLDDERHWYRYHRLFSDLLHKRLWQTHPDLVPVLHRRACAWHEQQGLMPEAIEHALAAHDFERAGILMEESVDVTLLRSEVTTFLNWVERLPDKSVRTRPALCFFHAWALLMNGRSPDIAEQRLQDIACAQDVPESAGMLAALRAYLMLLQADVHQAAELCREAMALLPESGVFLRNIVAWILSLVRLADGDLEDGGQALSEVTRMGLEIGNPLIAVAALCRQAKQHVRQGRSYRAQQTLERALQLATDSQGRRLPVASKALIGLGELEAEWNELAAAEDHLAEGIELAKQWSELAAFDAYLPLMRIRLAQGNVDAARQALETAQHIAQRSKATVLDDLIADLLQARFWVSQGDIAQAMRWAERRGLVPGVAPELPPGLDEGQDLVNVRLRKYEDLLLARLYVLQNRAAEALQLLEALLVQARQLSRVDLAIEIHVLRALAFQVEGNQTKAMAALAQALLLAEPGGYRRIFLDASEPMVRLLRQATSRGIAPAYVVGLLADFGESESVGPEAEPSCLHNQPLIEPLSARELEVLRLLATGLSNPEIAGELFVAVSTVRSHCKSIYGKLNVHRRWDAVHRAKELGLV